ncbi:MAG: GNAT family N-acetyltransferase [Treponema sp.]|nr:GNAT family N-acetyltransferase [Treponema sp.]
MQLRNATVKDIDSIMQVEKDSFIPEIQESEQTFLNRIKTFPSGFVVFESPAQAKSNSKSPASDSNCGTKSAQIAGYLCSEKWNQLPRTSSPKTASLKSDGSAEGSFLDDLFKLGHSIEKTHNDTGKILYISSFAILSNFRGKKLGSKLFSQSLQFILQKKENQNIDTLLLLVNENWKSALQIYKNYGFKEIKTISRIFPDSDGIIMKKEII